MDYLWSPWRMKYISNTEPVSGCVFCEAVHREDGPENLVLARGKTAYVIMNRYPYTSGHTMVVPYTHQSSIELLDRNVRSEIMELLTRIMQVTRAVYDPAGFNIGANVGTAAGAGIADHVHFHVVPRWGGDTNFMSALANTRVLPESLENSYQRLLEEWRKGD